MRGGIDYDMGKLFDADGRQVHGTSGVPVRRFFVFTSWPPALRYGDQTFFDTKRFEGGFRIYREAPLLEGWD